MINREALLKRHNPVLHGVETESPLTVGNGGFAFTADITGFQSLYDEYEIFPLCTMSQWGWHTDKAAVGLSMNDLVMTQYDVNGRKYEYASLPQPENEHIYHLLRHNPHRFNLARVSLMWDGAVIMPEELTDVQQELDLYTGVLKSSFELKGRRLKIITVCAGDADVLGFSVEASDEAIGYVSFCIAFPYGSHLKSASDWDKPDSHETMVLCEENVLFSRLMDDSRYSVLLLGSGAAESLVSIGAHTFEFRCTPDESGCTPDVEKRCVFSLSFSQDKHVEMDFGKVYLSGTSGRQRFWQKVGMVDLSKALDPRAKELERRVVLSQYLTAVQCAGEIPPQETGLSCNSWYGKFHLEMHIIHAGWFPLWNCPELLERSFAWYASVLEKAKENASRNSYKGARLPKMVDPEGVDSPSWIAPLLIWQQPHILYMLELVGKAVSEEKRFALECEYRELVNEVVLFMIDYLRLNKKIGSYELAPPLIPAQEEHEPMDVIDPVFEHSYWKFGIKLAERLLKSVTGEQCGERAGEPDGEPDRDVDEMCDEERGVDIVTKISGLPIIEGLYPAHRNCLDTFKKYNRDHPSMLYAYGFIPNESVDRQVMSDTVDKVLECWDRSTLWGWDFAMIAMTLTRLGRPEDAINVLLEEADKNSYAISGNNIQRGRDDLPLYLPGNGALLFALAMMLEGYGDALGRVGFPKNSLWDNIVTEGISPLPY